MISLKELNEAQNEEDTNIEKDAIENNGVSNDSDYWAIVLLALIWMQENENERLWNDFKEEIKHKTRFFPKSELLNKIDNISEYASAKLNAGTVLYRAREYKTADFLENKAVVALYDKLNDLLPHFKLQLDDIVSVSAMSNVSLALALKENNPEVLQQIIIQLLDEERPFWGFDEDNCDAPPKEKATAGRANSCGISFLYATNNIKTAIMEMRPQIGQNFSVCQVEICRDICIFDFTYIANELKEDEYSKSSDLYSASKEFSRPNYGIADDYIPTQYICEYLRQKGFDGIRYKSAVSPDGINIIIFNTDSDEKPYKIVESRVYAVNNIDIEYKQLLPFESKQEAPNIVKDN